MSQENVEIARRAYDAFSRHDLDAFTELLDPDVVFESLIFEAEGGVFRGHEGVRDFFGKLSEVFGQSWRSEITGVEEIGTAFLIIESRAVATGDAGGVPVEQAFWQASEVRRGQVVWWKFCRSKPEALEAVGLRE
ncbi:MAG: nuclear transport factor 2 family protein [Actinomycetota bacterium]|nr:nuclear transport factor 2 family protein [Actinomycetota bacterium]